MFSLLSSQDAFRAFHNDLDFVKKYMKSIHIGSLKKSQLDVKPVDKDFRELRDIAEKMVFIRFCFMSDLS